MNLICAVPLALSHLDSVSNPLTIIATPLRVLLRMHKGVILFLPLKVLSLLAQQV